VAADRRVGRGAADREGEGGRAADRGVRANEGYGGWRTLQYLGK
jgi:hypothetical protein